MDYTPAKIAASITVQYSAAHPDFVCRAEHVARVMPLRKPVYGDYDVCSWPTNAQMRTIQTHAFSDYRAAKARRVVPCPAPAGNNDRHDSYRLGMAHGWRTGLDWDGMTAEGRAYAAGAAMGQFWRN